MWLGEGDQGGNTTESVPEGRSKIAQRFIAGYMVVTTLVSPVGTAERLARNHGRNFTCRHVSRFPAPVQQSRRPVARTSFQSSLRDEGPHLGDPGIPAVNCWAIVGRPSGTGKKLRKPNASVDTLNFIEVAKLWFR